MNLRARLFLSFALIVVISLGIVAVSVSVLLQGYRDQAAMNRMDDMTRPLYVQIREAIRTRSAAEALGVVQEQANNNSTYVLFVDDNGNLVREVVPSGSSGGLTVSAGFPHGISQADHGIFTTDDGQRFVYSAYPLVKSIDILFPRPHTLVLCQPQSSVAFIAFSLLVPFIWAGIIALLISLLLAYLMARSVYRPIHRLSRAAVKIADGHYEERVPETGSGEIKELAVSFNEMAAKVEQSQQHLRHFVADVSHQLKSPLTSIQGFAQAMLDGTAADEETRMKATRIIVDESKRMIRQVNELLELSRMQAGQVRMASEPVSVIELLAQCQEIFALRFEEKSLKVTSKTEVKHDIIGDIDRLEDVFCNLLDNAVKNTPAGGEIESKAWEEGDQVKVSIADSGPGIPPEQIPFVFERFQQLSGLRSGFGLGLAIAREIAVAHRGKIEVTSPPGEGACFTVTLPAAGK